MSIQITLTPQQVGAIRELISSKQDALAHRHTIAEAQNTPARAAGLLECLRFWDDVDALLRGHAARAVVPAVIRDEQIEPFSFDSRGVNGNDEYKRRLATLTEEGHRLKVGELFAQSPRLLANLKAFVALADEGQADLTADETALVSDSRATIATIERATS